MITSVRWELVDAEIGTVRAYFGGGAINPVGRRNEMTDRATVVPKVIRSWTFEP